MSPRSCLLALVASVFAFGCDAAPRPTPPSSAHRATTSGASALASGSTAPSSAVPSSRPPVDPPAPDAVGRLARSANAFGLDAYALLRKEKGNLVFSPVSLATALAMTWGGARGETAAEMQKVLHLEGSPDETMKTAGQLAASLGDPRRAVTCRIANRLFGEKTFTFEQAFLDATAAAYGAPLEPLDFVGAPGAARARINAWVEEQTASRIKDLLPPPAVTSDTRLVLTNAVYFLGNWTEPFDKMFTSPATFRQSASQSSEVPTMHAMGSHGFAAADGAKALEIDYQGGDMAAVFVLPDAVDGLDALEASLDEARLAAIVAALKPETVSVALPKFEIAPANALALKGTLIALGMPRAFDVTRADLTGIGRPTDPANLLYISDVFHKAFVRVDEKGTEAAAASAVVVAEGAGAPPAPHNEFVADHPFLFFVRDRKSGLVLFMGRVADPAAH